MMIQEAGIEFFSDRWPEGEISSGQRVILEGAHHDTTAHISLVATILDHEIPEGVSQIRYGPFGYKRWSKEDQGDLLVIPDKGFQRFSVFDFSWLRAIILEDGRVFLGEAISNKERYIRRILHPAIMIAAEKLGENGNKLLALI